MTTIGPDDDEHEDFDVSVEPAPKMPVVEAEADDEDQRKRDAAAASTYHQALAHDGKTDEELIEERQDMARLVVDAAIIVGVAAAIAHAHDDDAPDAEIAEDGAETGAALEDAGAVEEDDDGGE